MSLNINKIKNIHFIGIGGLFISSIPFFFLNINKNINITGSDIGNNEIIKYLKKNNIKVYNKHDSSNINNNIDFIIYSNSIKNNNPEILKAKKLNIPIYNKKYIIKYISNFYKNVISISGSHGKTTISCIIVYILNNLNINFSYIIGGFLLNEKKNFNFCNDKNIIVLESDESDLTFENVKCKYFVLNNIDNDHINNYKNNINNIINSFIKYINCNNKMLTFLNLDDFLIKKIINKISNKFITYGFNKKSDFIIYDYKINYNNNIFTILNKIDNCYYNIFVSNCFGKFNSINITAVISLLYFIKKNIVFISMYEAILNLKKFCGIKRRFEILNNLFFIDKLNNKINNILLITDYGHHPKEIYNIIYNVKLIYNKKIIMIFQPHRYSRTYLLFNNFIKVLLNVNILIILDIYPAFEKNIYNISSYNIYYILKKINKNKVFYVKNNNINNIIYIIKKNINSNNYIIIVQGAGSISNYISNLFKKNE
ncbi:Mur ligase domain-containing protein [Candidatus Nardonella dryophthoridicola]|uniref:UDP-N-acetylmuramate--L-alanine ligase n=1 Tax=endosymbiont of Rhynchophorus ferrugineus TaxID=1972133 RepID=A0A2Z5T3L0_9GAMM|nr:Mur ligase domain-containing protein [Candidatus Nardonella dryophthoridicola]QTJ62928.1 UDP-N-acetylmuramate--L-alanine ligase [Candidatus Nardonella dryophthoridicola]BBA84980.1 UDP-N-acetylmuramate--L-alanine ligase [endosymbiont of Rhynchophorus ferrugineus]